MKRTKTTITHLATDMIWGIMDFLSYREVQNCSLVAKDLWKKIDNKNKTDKYFSNRLKTHYGIHPYFDKIPQKELANLVKKFLPEKIFSDEKYAYLKKLLNLHVGQSLKDLWNNFCNNQTLEPKPRKLFDYVITLAIFRMLELEHRPTYPEKYPAKFWANINGKEFMPFDFEKDDIKAEEKKNYTKTIRQLFMNSGSAGDQSNSRCYFSHYNLFRGNKYDNILIAISAYTQHIKYLNMRKKADPKQQKEINKELQKARCLRATKYSKSYEGALDDRLYKAAREENNKILEYFSAKSRVLKAEKPILTMVKINLIEIYILKDPTDNNKDAFKLITEVLRAIATEGLLKNLKPTGHSIPNPFHLRNLYNSHILQLLNFLINTHLNHKLSPLIVGYLLNHDPASSGLGNYENYYSTIKKRLEAINFLWERNYHQATEIANGQYMGNRGKDPGKLQFLVDILLRITTTTSQLEGCIKAINIIYNHSRDIGPDYLFLIKNPVTDIYDCFIKFAVSDVTTTVQTKVEALLKLLEVIKFGLSTSWGGKNNESRKSICNLLMELSFNPKEPIDRWLLEQINGYLFTDSNHGLHVNNQNSNVQPAFDMFDMVVAQVLTANSKLMLKAAKNYDQSRQEWLSLHHNLLSKNIPFNFSGSSDYTRIYIDIFGSRSITEQIYTLLFLSYLKLNNYSAALNWLTQYGTDKSSRNNPFITQSPSATLYPTPQRFTNVASVLLLHFIEILVDVRIENKKGIFFQLLSTLTHDRYQALKQEFHQELGTHLNKLLNALELTKDQENSSLATLQTLFPNTRFQKQPSLMEDEGRNDNNYGSFFQSPPGEEGQPPSDLFDPNFNY